MTDVQHLKDKGIPLKIDGTTRFVKGATKYTTCGDVIKMVLKKTGVKKEYRHLFAIYEVSSDEERALPCKGRIVKVVGSWRGEPNKLVLRKSEPLSPRPCNEKKKKWNLKKKPKEQVPEVRKLKDPYMQTIHSLVEMVDKRREQLQTASSSDDRDLEGFGDSTSDSDSSIDEFLSKLDHSKMAGLINFFAALATKKQKRVSRQRSISSSTQESDESSSASPVKPRRRKVKKSRQPLLKTSKYRNSRSRMRESADMHPNKMHAVKRVNFGFIDAEPRSHDIVYSLSDVRSMEEDDTRVRSNSNRIFSARRRLIPSRRCSYNVQEENYTGQWSVHGRSLSEVNARVEPCKLRRLSENCKEVWCESPIPSVDSGNEESLDSSSDLDTAFILKSNCEDVMNSRHYIDTPEQGRIFRNCSNNKHITSSVRKLVNYSMTDDELGDTDSEDLSETCGTEEESFQNVVKVHSVTHSMCKEQIIITEGKGLMEEKSHGICANFFKNNSSSCQEMNRDVSNYIKSIFGKTVENEDEEMTSFMKSMVLNDSSDEGLSSMGSDLDLEKID